MEDRRQADCPSSAASLPLLAISPILQCKKLSIPSSKLNGKMSDCLPQEALVEIFCKLPTKTLLRCTSVCKSWYSLIRSPIFISTQLTKANHNNNDNLLLLFLHCPQDGEERFSIHLDDEQLSDYLDLPLPPRISDKSSWNEVIGSCNGVLCLAHHVEYTIDSYFLWNPSIRKSLFLPQPQSFFLKDELFPQEYLGFGFDSCTNDYKLLRIVQFLDRISSRQVSVNYELYSLSTGSWRNISSVAPDLEIAQGTSPFAFVNGFLHYVGFQRIKSVDHGAERFNNSILAFDVKNEIFQKVMLPKALADVRPLWLFIWKYKETSIGIVDDNSFGLQFRIWVMKEYGLEPSWTKLLIVKESPYSGDELSGLVGCRNNGELFLSTSVQTSEETFSGGIISYNTETRKHRDLRFWWKEYGKRVCSYTESLVLLDIGRGASEEMCRKKSDCLPQEVLVEIFRKLPTKTLLRCTSVCKSWYSLIRSPIFISTQLTKANHNNNNNLLLLFLHCPQDGEERFSIHLDDEQLSDYLDLPLPPRISDKSSWNEVIGSCNGVLCLAHHVEYTIDSYFLWNPSIRKSLFLPQPQSFFLKDELFPQEYLGFGFDSCTNDYKLLRIVQFLDRISSRQVSVNYELYSLSTGSWRNISSVAPDLEIAQGTSPFAFVNGFLHYVGFQRIKSVDHGAERCNNSILAFDVKNEIFQEVMLPKALADVRPLWLFIWTYKETSIGVIDYNSFGLQFPIWVMKEYGLESSWTKLLIVKESPYSGDELSGLVGCRNNGELFLSTSVQTSKQTLSGGIISYNTETRKHRDLRFWWKEYNKHVCSYMESLVLLDIGSGASDEMCRKFGEDRQMRFWE